MAMTVRYFDASAAGAGDGTTWADRAALYTGGAWSTVITGFNFSGSDGLECRIYGSSSIGAALLAASFANPPTASNPLILHGCDSSGNRLTPSDPNWTSDLPAWDDSGLPVLATTTNIATVNIAHTYARLLKLTASGRNAGIVLSFGGMDWCSGINSTANTNAAVLGNGYTVVTNSLLSCTGSSYLAIVLAGVNDQLVKNCRIVGVTGSSGNRDGIGYSGSTGTFVIDGCTSVANGGRGIAYTGTATGPLQRIVRCTVVGNGGDGILFPNTASQTTRQHIDHCMITGNGGYGINPTGTNTHLVVTNSRLRDNTSGNFGTWGNYPQNFDSYTTDSDDATEYVNSGAGNYQIKSGATIHGYGFGVSEEAASGSSGGGPVIGGRLVA